jgi:hypothetical protein
LSSANASLLVVSYVNRITANILPNKADCRFRPEVDVRFITDELGFETDAECIKFLEKRNAEIFPTDGKWRIKTKEALEAFEVDRRKLFRVVDIKGQL